MDVPNSFDVKGLEAKALENMAGNLVWRIGRLTDDAPLTVRIGLASSIKAFNDLPKLRSANDSEIETAMKEKNFRIEWVGRMP
ncbi:MAG: DUF3248 domain-containing protein [Trueperaceae bacterium]